MTFWLWRQNNLPRKVRLVSRATTTQAGQQIITIHYCPISQEVKGISNEIWFNNKIQRGNNFLQK